MSILMPAVVMHPEAVTVGFDDTVRTVRRFVVSLTPKPLPVLPVCFETSPGY